MEDCVEECCDCDERYTSEKEQLESFDDKEFEARITEDLTYEIEKYLSGKELEEKKRAIRTKVATSLKDKYFKGKLPSDLPHKLKVTMRALALSEDESECDVMAERPFKSPYAVELSDEEMKKLQDEVRKLQKRQDEIVELVLNKEEYLKKDNKNLMGSFVSEYKKLEGLKSSYLDRLQAAYCAEPQHFDNHFCEANPVDADHRF